MKRGFFGGTFNPPHRGHVAAARAAAEQLGLDTLYVIPAGTPPHKELPAGSPTAAERLEMAKLAFGEIPGLQVLDWELKRPGRSYTAETVERLLSEGGDGELWLLCGTDMFRTLPDWYRGQWLLRTLCVAVYPRKDGEEEEIDALIRQYGEAYSARARRIVLPPVPLSSTEIRGRLPEGRGAKSLPGSVYAFILKNRLYGVRPEPEALWELVKPRYKASRVPHVLGCREEAVRLAERWGADRLDAENAAILHDITKNMPPEEQLALCRERGVPVPDYRPELEAMLHAFSGAAAAAMEYGVSPQVESAIRWHTTGRADMTLLEKIIWLADYIEPNRTTPGVEAVRRAAYEDLNKALALALENSLAYLEHKGFPPHPATREALAFLKRGDTGK